MTKILKGKVKLYKLLNSQWFFCSSGYLNPNPLEKGKGVWVGSISSREGYTTTEIVSLITPVFSEECVCFKTKNQSDYLITPLDFDLPV